MKYIVVVGGTMSGLGKGMTASSIGVILQSLGYKVTFIKIDPYINVDAGNLSPYDHGEVFVLNDGTEVDLDFGNYERFLGIYLSNIHSITTGKVYREIIERERNGKYLGKTVQIVPHMTDLICEKILKAANTPIERRTNESNNYATIYDTANKIKEAMNEVVEPDTCIIEVGGTVGDIESLIFVEALRQFKLRVGKENFMTISVNYLPVLESGEQKTKPVQNSVKQSIMHGLKPDMIICRSSKDISESIKRKISIFCEVAEDGIFYSKTIKNVFELPFVFESQGMTKKIISCLKLQPQANLKVDLKNYFFNLADLGNRSKRITIAIIAKYGLDDDCYMSIVKAIEFSAIKLGTHVELKWVDATSLENDGSVVEKCLSICNGVIIPGGFGIRGVSGKIAAIKYCRENKIPILGICLGFQLMAIEFCRHVLRIKGATSEEFVGSAEKRDADRIQYLFDRKYQLNAKNKICMNKEGLADSKTEASTEESTESNENILNEDCRLKKRTKIVFKDAPKSVENENNDKSADFNNNGMYFVVKYMPISNENSEESMRLGKQHVILKSGTKTEKIYGGNLICERFRHRYGLNPVLRNILEINGIICAGQSLYKERIDVLELENHPFFLGVQFHPELLANPRFPHPLFSALVEKSLERIVHKN